MVANARYIMLHGSVLYVPTQSIPIESFAKHTQQLCMVVCVCVYTLLPQTHSIRRLAPCSFTKSQLQKEILFERRHRRAPPPVGTKSRHRRKQRETDCPSSCALCHVAWRPSGSQTARAQATLRFLRFATNSCFLLLLIHTCIHAYMHS